MEGREKPMVFFAFLSSGDIDGATLTFSCWARGTVTVLLLYFLVNIVVLFFFLYWWLVNYITLFGVWFPGLQSHGFWQFLLITFNFSSRLFTVLNIFAIL